MKRLLQRRLLLSLLYILLLLLVVLRQSLALLRLRSARGIIRDGDIDENGIDGQLLFMVEFMVEIIDGDELRMPTTASLVVASPSWSFDAELNDEFSCR